MHKLLTIDEAARELGVPAGSLRTAARKYGYLIRMGRAIRIDPTDFPELIRSCQDSRKDRDSTATSTRSGVSATMVGNSSQRAQETAAKLKLLSRDTSPRRADRTGQVRQNK